MKGASLPGLRLGLAAVSLFCLLSPGFARPPVSQGQVPPPPAHSQEEREKAYQEVLSRLKEGAGGLPADMLRKLGDDLRNLPPDQRDKALDHILRLRGMSSKPQDGSLPGLERWAQVHQARRAFYSEFPQLRGMMRPFFKGNPQARLRDTQDLVEAKPEDPRLRRL
ncbi:MAG: hypothetical protein AAB339_01170, partial [Elusimicrobiota bacterium]